MRIWSKEAVVTEIQDRRRKGWPLSYSTIERENLRLMRAACYYFGTWQKAVEAAGIVYADVRKPRHWTKEAILARIRELYAGGHDLSWTHVSRVADPQLASVAIQKNRFGSWRAAVEAAGFDYEEVSRYRRWSPERVIEEVRTLAHDGQPLNSKAVQRQHCALFTAGRRHFGSWDRALTAAGLDPAEARRRLPAAEAG